MPNRPNSTLVGRIADARALWETLRSVYDRADYHCIDWSTRALGSDSSEFTDVITDLAGNFAAEGRPVIQLADPAAPITKQRHFRVPFGNLWELDRLVQLQKLNNEPICVTSRPGAIEVGGTAASDSKAVTWIPEEVGMALGSRPGLVSALPLDIRLLAIKVEDLEAHAFPAPLGAPQHVFS